MRDQDDVLRKVLDAVIAAGGESGPVDMTLLGPPLVAAGYDVNGVAYAIETLIRNRLVERVGSNSIRIMKNPV